jgi:N-acetylglucosamine kinase-like BadF-type ATPase
MILVADSGSTKTEWWWYDANNEIKKAVTIGFNPYFINSEGIYDALLNTLLPEIDVMSVEKIFFYGSGCLGKKNCEIIYTACKKAFSNAVKIEVLPDTLGAARALFGLKSGIAGILGTGSNSVYYNGIDTAECIPSLGYIIADEGSGARFGTTLIREYFKDEMPEEIKVAFEKRYNPSLEVVLDAVYRKPHPNRFLASFCDFLSYHKNHPYIQNLIRNEFQAFLKYQVCKCPEYHELTLSLIGSIAFFLGDVLREEAQKMGIQVGKILRSPIEGLIQFHQDYN